MQWIGIGLIVLFALWKGRSLVAAAAGDSLSWLGTSKPTRMTCLEHLDAAFAYFESIKCQEGMDAIKTAGQHAFEHREVTP